jgi:hypothetical protein
MAAHAITLAHTSSAGADMSNCSVRLLPAIPHKNPLVRGRLNVKMPSVFVASGIVTVTRLLRSDPDNANDNPLYVAIAPS